MDEVYEKIRVLNNAILQGEDNIKKLNLEINNVDESIRKYENDEEKVKQAVLHFKENYHIIEEKPTKPIMIREVLS